MVPHFARSAGGVFMVARTYLPGAEPSAAPVPATLGQKGPDRGQKKKAALPVAAGQK